MSTDLTIALQVAQTYEIICKMRSVASDAFEALEDSENAVKPEIAALLKAHLEHLVSVAGDLLPSSNLVRHVHWAMRSDMLDIVRTDLPTIEAGIRSKISAMASGANPLKYAFEDLLEEKIKSASLNLYAGGHHKAAVLAACDVITQELRSRTGLTLDGVDLVNQSFGGKAPILTWKEGEDKASLSIRNGYTDLARGAMAAIRNAYTHSGNINYGSLHVARHLVFLSTLLHRLQRAKVVNVL